MDYINIHELTILITTSAAPAMATDTPVTNTKKKSKLLHKPMQQKQ